MKQPQRLGELLVNEGLISSDRLQDALDRQRLLGGLLGTNLLDLGGLDESTLLKALGRQVAAPIARHEDLTEVSPQVLSRLPVELAERYQVVPFRVDGNTLLIASMAPGSIPVEDALAEATQLMIRTHVSLELRLWEALHRYYRIEAPLRLIRMIEEWQKPAGSSLVLPPDRTRETQPLNRLVVPEPSPFEMLDTPPSDESLWGGLHLDDIQARVKPRDAMAELEEAIRLSGSDDFTLREPDAETDPDDTQPVLPQTSGTRRDLDETDNPSASFDRSEASEQARSDRFSRLVHPSTPFAGALDELSRTDQRERVADVLLDVTAPYFKRRLLLAARKKRVIGWCGEGEGLVSLRVHALNFIPETSPIFLALSKGSPFWLGTLVENAVHSRIAATFGGDWPNDCLVLPISVRDRIIAYFYADNVDGSVAGAPVSELLPVMSAASVGLMRFIQERRLRRSSLPT